MLGKLQLRLIVMSVQMFLQFRMKSLIQFAIIIIIWMIHLVYYILVLSQRVIYQRFPCIVFSCFSPFDKDITILLYKCQRWTSSSCCCAKFHSRWWWNHEVIINDEPHVKPAGLVWIKMVVIKMAISLLDKLKKVVMSKYMLLGIKYILMHIKRLLMYINPSAIPKKKELYIEEITVVPGIKVSVEQIVTIKVPKDARLEEIIEEMEYPMLLYAPGNHIKEMDDSTMMSMVLLAVKPITKNIKITLNNPDGIKMKVLVITTTRIKTSIKVTEIQPMSIKIHIEAINQIQYRMKNTYGITNFLWIINYYDWILIIILFFDNNYKILIKSCFCHTTFSLVMNQLIGGFISKKLPQVKNILWLVIKPAGLVCMNTGVNQACMNKKVVIKMAIRLLLVKLKQVWAYPNAHQSSSC